MGGCCRKSSYFLLAPCSNWRAISIFGFTFCLAPCNTAQCAKVLENASNCCLLLMGNSGCGRQLQLRVVQCCLNLILIRFFFLSFTPLPSRLDLLNRCWKSVEPGRAGRGGGGGWFTRKESAGDGFKFSRLRWRHVIAPKCSSPQEQHLARLPCRHHRRLVQTLFRRDAAFLFFAF